MVIGGSQQETLNLGFVLLGIRQQGIPLILRELILPDGFDPVSHSFTVRDVTTGTWLLADQILNLVNGRFDDEVIIGILQNITSIN
ncbi:unnamed protein product [Schistosoma curassoni]|uniref:Transcriptional regulator n=1 Tax=Schistosoma curassoni TaxID=6186 RepID=A0A183KQG5_9TREM|nr:unnamed protein product [Schistosoma curassoni]